MTEEAIMGAGVQVTEMCTIDGCRKIYTYNDLRLPALENINLESVTLHMLCKYIFEAGIRASAMPSIKISKMVRGRIIE